MNKFIAYILFLAVVLFASCNSSRNMLQREYDIAGKNVAENIAAASSLPDFCSYRMKASLKVNGKSVSANSVLRVDGGNLILMSVTLPLLGIEVGRMEVDADEIRVIDKMGKRYVALTFQELSKAAGATVSYNTVKSAFMSRIFSLPGKELTDARKISRIFDIEELGGARYKLSQKGLDGRLAFEVSDEGKALTKTSVRSGGNSGLECRYSDFVEKGGFVLPEKIRIDGTVKSYKINLEMQAREINLEPVKIKQLNLERYNRVSFEDCMKMLDLY